MTSTIAQEAFLRDFHARHPAVTARTLGSGRAPDGRSSYAHLADRVAGRGRVLDLGCGDGPLLEILTANGSVPTGLDLSPEALALARRRPATGGARVVRGRAQQLPFAGASFDAVASHMALMLMGDIEQVAAETARVLVPGGVLVCALGGGAAGGGEAYELFVALLRATLGDAPPERRIPALGDRRTRTREGFDAVFTAAGFAPSDWQTLPFDLGGPAEQVWSTVSGVYDLAPLDTATVESLRAAFLAEAAALTAPGGHLPCVFRMHFVTAHLR
jgi:SAM-dependent methyltransferase